MAFQSIWYFTDLPQDTINTLEKELCKYDSKLEESRLHGDVLDKGKRKSTNGWLSSDSWIAGFLWHYVQKANRNNFLYDLTHIDGESLQYTRYGVGEYYGWHTDHSLATYHKPSFNNIPSAETLNNANFHTDRINQSYEEIRKLSFSLQLSNPDDYEGGNVVLLDDNNKQYVAPRQRGSIILFDSRTMHRVCKVTKGVRKSIVGWVVGPRWK